MPEILTTELKSDLETIYKTTGDLLNLIQEKNIEFESEETKQLMDSIKSKLEAVEGTLQKDIYNCDYLLTKIKTSYNYFEEGSEKRNFKN